MMDLILYPQPGVDQPVVQCRRCRARWPINPDEPFMEQIRVVVIHGCGHLGVETVDVSV
jgi:hypothetical protein